MIELLHLQSCFARRCPGTVTALAFLLAILAISLALPALGQPISDQLSGQLPAQMAATAATAGAAPATAPPYLQGQPSIPAQFSGDWYSVDGGPDLQAALVRSSVYQNEDTSIHLMLTNTGRVTSFKVVTDPVLSRPDEVFAAQKELQLEALRSTAQDVSVRLQPQNDSAMKLKREMAFAGSLREGQVSPVLEFPVEIFEFTAPGDYTLYALVNYTRQQDVAVKPHSNNPQNPDVFYWYNAASQIVPLTLRVERRSLVDLKALHAAPEGLDVGSKDNVVRVTIQNQGNDTASDLVARLRPETGVYVDMDESPVQNLRPGQKADLVYKVDVSKDTIPGKQYRFTLLFDYSDTYRKDLSDSDYVYITIRPSLATIIYQYWWLAAVAAAIIALIAISVIRRRRSAAGR